MVEYGSDNVAGKFVYERDVNDSQTQDSGENGVGDETIFVDENGDGVPDDGEPSATTNASGS